GGGNDTLIGGVGSDTFLFGAGYGQDVVVTDGNGSGDADILFIDNTDPSSIVLSREGSDLLLAVHDFGDLLRVTDYFVGNTVSESTIQLIRFSDGAEWDRDAI